MLDPADVADDLDAAYAATRDRALTDRARARIAALRRILGAGHA